MSYNLGFMIECLVGLLLLVTIGYCMVLNGRLRRLRADEQSLKATIAELITATEIAERAVGELKHAARESDASLGARLKVAEKRCDELERLSSAGDVVIKRLTRVVIAARTLDEIPAMPPATDPKAVAEAARSFADRLRARVAALAA